MSAEREAPDWYDGDDQDDRKPAAKSIGGAAKGSSGGNDNANANNNSTSRQEQQAGEAEAEAQGAPADPEDEAAALAAARILERKRKISRLSSQRNREKQRNAIDTLQKQQGTLLLKNQGLKTENDEMRSRIAMLRRCMRVPANTSIGTAAASAATTSSVSAIGSARGASLSSLLAPSVNGIPTVSAATAAGLTLPSSLTTVPTSTTALNNFRSGNLGSSLLGFNPSPAAQGLVGRPIGLGGAAAWFNFGPTTPEALLSLHRRQQQIQQLQYLAQFQNPLFAQHQLLPNSLLQQQVQLPAADRASLLPLRSGSTSTGAAATSQGASTNNNVADPGQTHILAASLLSRNRAMAPFLRESLVAGKTGTDASLSAPTAAAAPVAPADAAALAIASNVNNASSLYLDRQHHQHPPDVVAALLRQQQQQQQPRGQYLSSSGFNDNSSASTNNDNSLAAAIMNSVRSIPRPAPDPEAKHEEGKGDDDEEDEEEAFER